LYEVQSKWDTCCECCEVFFKSNTVHNREVNIREVEVHNSMDMFEMFNIKNDCNKSTQTDYEIVPNRNNKIKKVIV